MYVFVAIVGTDKVYVVVAIVGTDKVYVVVAIVGTDKVHVAVAIVGTDKVHVVVAIVGTDKVYIVIWVYYSWRAQPLHCMKQNVSMSNTSKTKNSSPFIYVSRVFMIVSLVQILWISKKDLVSNFRFDIGLYPNTG